METTTIIYIILAFVAGIVIGTAISWNHQANCNINAGLPLKFGMPNTVNQDAHLLHNFLQRRMVQCRIDYISDGYTKNQMRLIKENIVPYSGYSNFVKDFLFLIGGLGLEMELRVRDKSIFARTTRDNTDSITVHTNFT